MFCSSKKPKEVFNLYLPSLQIQSFVAHSRRNNTRVSNHDQNGVMFVSIPSPTKRLVHSHAILPALRDSRPNFIRWTLLSSHHLKAFLDSCARTWLDPGMCFKYFFSTESPNTTDYKPNNLAAAVTYKKNWIGKKTKYKEHVKEKTRNKKVFFKKRPDEQRKQTTDKFENVCGQMCSPCWSCRSTRFCPSSYLVLQSSQTKSIILMIDHSELFLFSSPPHSCCFPSFSSLSVISSISDAKIFRLGHILRTVQ